MKLVRDAYHSWGAEVVFITSNYQGNKEIMEGCKEEGIPAFVRHLFPSYPFYSLADMFTAGYSVGLLNTLSLAEWYY